eukprot:5790917-Amphidinium_carterae.1
MCVPTCKPLLNVKQYPNKDQARLRKKVNPLDCACSASARGFFVARAHFLDALLAQMHAL